MLLAALLLAAAAQAQQGEPALMKRAAELRETPGETARSLAPLPAQSPVTRTGERQGPWIQVKLAAGATGWVHMFDVGPATATAGTSAPAGNSATGALRGITNFFNKGGPQVGATSPTSTIGIRGLGAEDLANAQPNMNGVTQMETLRQNEAQAREFASQSALAAASVPALPVPARARAAQGGPNQGQMP
ncbi:MAG: SH3 domain-containing protein [Ramlibacter sp.]